ncbi:MAG: flagellar biosynthetic protein FliR [Bryobacteraceae bacterium]
MHVEIPIGTLIGFLMVLTRVSGVFAFLPIAHFRAASVPTRFIMSIACTLLLEARWPRSPILSGAPEAGVALLVQLAGEALLGLSSGLVLSLLVETFSMAAQFLGLQAGFGYASTIDPNSEADSGILLVLAQLTSWLLFLSLGLERHLLRSLALSLERLPAGSFAVTGEARAAVLGMGAVVVTTAFRLALPVIALLMLVDIGFASLGKLHSQLQLLTLAFPIKMLMAVAVLAASLGIWSRLFESTALHAVGALTRIAGGT